MAGSPSDSAGAQFALRVVAGLRGYFGRNARSFGIQDVQEDANLIAFSITFEIYDFYPMIFNYDRGFFGFAIPFGDLAVSVLSDADVPDAFNDMAALSAELDRRVRLRIPDKYLDSYTPAT